MAIQTYNTYSSEKGYKSKITVGEKYFDNRYADVYEVLEIQECQNGVRVLCKYSKRGLVNESADFILYCIDAKQHSLYLS